MAVAFFDRDETFFGNRVHAIFALVILVQFLFIVFLIMQGSSVDNALDAGRNDVEKIDLKLLDLELLAGDSSVMIAGLDESVVTVQAGDSLGSGFFVTDSGHLVTNYHVVQKESGDVLLYMANGSVFTGEVIGVNATLDVALLLINISSGNALPLRSSNGIEVGEKVFAIGSPFGLAHSVSSGIVSGKDRMINLQPFYVQTDATMDVGNSGGPLLDRDGNVVGMNNFKLSDQGFALASEKIVEVVNGIYIRNNSEVLL
ncbi:MAG: S1-C subfamily serine protease [Patescibacteria group bacterium]|jgi:S1-C subfamily serine protease